MSLVHSNYRCTCNKVKLGNLSSISRLHSDPVGAVDREKGGVMTVEYVDGLKIMRLHDCSGAGGHTDDGMAVLRIWQLVTGGHAMRDASVFNRRL